MRNGFGVLRIAALVVCLCVLGASCRASVNDGRAADETHKSPGTAAERDTDTALQNPGVAPPPAAQTPAPTLAVAPTPAALAATSIPTAAPSPTATSTPAVTPTATPTVAPTHVPMPTPSPTPLVPVPRPGLADQVISPSSRVPIAAFRVVDDRLESFGVADALVDEGERIWARFVAIVPPERRQSVTVLFLWDNLRGGASVIRHWNLDEWQLSVDRAVTAEALDELLLHEFAHMLTLNLDEMSVVADTAACATVMVGSACAHSDSVIAAFHDRFWSEEVRALTAFLSTYEQRRQYFESNDTDFVTAYALTNVAEDLAESFVRFVVDDLPPPQVSPLDTVVMRKVRFLATRSGLIELRHDMRQNLGLGT